MLLYRDVRLNRHIVLVAATVTTALLSSSRVVTADRASASAHGKTIAPLAFERNDGQHDPAIRYRAHHGGYSVSMLDGSVVLGVRTARGTESSVRMGLGPLSRTPAAEAPLAGRVNYLVGCDRTSWRTNIPTFERVRYRNVFDGIDVVFYGREQQLEYDVVVAPGANPRDARVTFTGTDSLRLEPDGSLALVGERELRFSRPIAYQRIGSGRRFVEVSYRLSGDSIGFDVGDYDRTRELVIDPVIVFSTYLGGRSNDSIYDAAVDAAGSTFVTGQSDSPDFPVARAAQSTKRGTANAVISKFTRDGALVYSTYFGGSYYDIGMAIDVDPSGAAYVAGTTLSADLPVTAGAFQPNMIGGNHNGFVLKLSASGDRIAYATYLGEIVFGGPNDVAVDPSGYATVVGSTSSSTFPTTTGAIDRTNTYPNSTGFAAKLNPTGTALVYSTLLTGEGQAAAGVALDSAGRPVIVGRVSGTMTTTKPNVGSTGKTDAFLMKLNQTGTSMLYSVRMGGTNDDLGNAVVLDSNEAPHIVGTTYSADFPVGNYVFQNQLKGATDAFVAQFKPDGTIVPFYTGLFGGSDAEFGYGIGIAGGYVTIFGETFSRDLPLRDPVQDHFAGSGDGFMATLANWPELLFATYIGGTGDDSIRSGVIDGAGIMTMAGLTYSHDFPTSHAFQSSNHSVDVGYPDGFVARASLLPRGTPGPRDTAVHVADGATLHGDWERVADATAAGGTRLHNPDRGAAKITQALAAPADYFDVTVNGLFGGPYMVWVRGKADNNSYSNDSVFLQFSNASNSGDDADDERPIYRIGTTEGMAVTIEDCSGCGLHGWGWQDSGYGKRIGGTAVYFNSGQPTTIRVQRREDGISIDQIVLAREDHTAGPYFFSAPGYQKDDDTIMTAQQPDLHGGSLDVVLYAAVDHPVLHGAWTIVADSTAAGGARVSHPDAGAPKLAAPLANPVNYFDLHFQANAGVAYRLWIRGKAKNNDYANDSVFVQFSDSVDASGNEQWRTDTPSATTINLEDCSGCGLSGWGWQDNGYGANVLGPPVYFASPGDHTIRIQTREDGLSIDQIVLSPVNYAGVAPGATKNDTTILPK